MWTFLPSSEGKYFIISKHFVTSILFSLILLSKASYALLEIEITQGVESALPIAITPVSGDIPVEATLLESVVFSDLHRSGFFSIIDKSLRS